MSDRRRNRNHPGEQVKEGPLTYDDYAALDNGIRYELANGILEMMGPAPSPVHQLFVQNLEDLLKESCSTKYLFFTAPIDVILSAKEVRQPDIVAVLRDRVHIITRRGIEGPPDLVVEVVSPTSVKRDRQEKLRVYAAYGIPEYLIVTVELAALEQYVLDQGEYRIPAVYQGDDPIQSDVLTCATFSIADVMRRMPDLPNA
jgi:Uma2 family endonuclease